MCLRLEQIQSNDFNFSDIQQREYGIKVQKLSPTAQRHLNNDSS